MNSEILGALDSVFVTMDSANAPLHIGIALELEPSEHSAKDPEVRFAEISSAIEERLGGIEVLRRRLLRVPFDLGPPVIVDDPDFDISFHVVRRAVPSPGGPSELEKLIARIMARPLAPDRPLWEISVIEGLEGGATALLAKVHHALADGVSGVTVFAGLFDLSAEQDHHPAEREELEIPAIPSPVELLTRSSSEILRRPGALLDAIGSSLQRLAGKVDEITGAAEPAEQTPSTPSLLDAPRTSLTGTVSYARNFERFGLPIDVVKEAAHRHDATVTDFAMAMVGGALRRLLEHRGELIDDDLIAFVPVNIRAPGTEGDLGNKISGRLVPLHALSESPELRLAALGADSRMRRETEGGESSDFINDLAEAAGPVVASFAGRVISAFDLFEHLPHVANVIVSSVPGPPIPLWCVGERIIRASPMGPLMFNQALNVTLLSYDGTLEFGILACARKVPDAAFLKVLLEEEAADLFASGVTSER